MTGTGTDLRGEDVGDGRRRASPHHPPADAEDGSTCDQLGVDGTQLVGV